MALSTSLGAILGLSNQATGQAEFAQIPAGDIPVFDLDWAAFKAGPDSLRLECYYKIVNPRLSYVRRSLKSSEVPNAMPVPAGDSAEMHEFYVAAYEINAILSSGEDEQVATVGKRENYALPSFEETRNPSGYLVNVLVMTISPGDYELAVTLTDRVSGGLYTQSKSVPLREALGAGWVIGGPMFIDPAAAAPANPLFHKQETALVPSVTRAFAGAKDRLAFYVEVYRDLAPNAVLLEIESEQRFGKMKQVDTIPITTDEDIVPVVYKSALTGFKTGEATLRIALLAENGKRLGAPLEIPFWVDWSMAGMVDDNWEDAVDMLVHIATHDELKALRAASPETRAESFAAFWKSKDPSPQTDENEWQTEYYRRIRHADLQFTTAFMRGWRTDLGTVYVKYGEPDEIDRHPFERGSKPYQLWYYYAQRRRFLFVDSNGNGDYQLQYPYDGLIR